MNRKSQEEHRTSRVREDVLRVFAEDADPPVHVSANGLVSVTMDARYHVHTVSIEGVQLEPAEKTRLEQAVARAVEGAIREVRKLNTGRIIGVFGRRRQQS